jgi:5'-3' exonuclease
MQYLIDASVYVFRAHYSMPDDMVDDDGNPINALYGYCRFLGNFMEQVNPEYVAVLFDESLSKSFRTEIYPEYKANRDPAPPELKRQFAQCRRFTRALGLMECASPKYEADDLIGTLVTEGREKGRPSTIVSRDKDLTQLVSKVAGDSVDNIPGVPGVGKKTATALLQHFGSLEKVYDNLDYVPSRPTSVRSTRFSTKQASARHCVGRRHASRIWPERISPVRTGDLRA